MHDIDLWKLRRILCAALETLDMSTDLALSREINRCVLAASEALDRALELAAVAQRTLVVECDRDVASLVSVRLPN